MLWECGRRIDCDWRSERLHRGDSLSGVLKSEKNFDRKVGNAMLKEQCRNVENIRSSQCGIWEVVWCELKC